MDTGGHWPGTDTSSTGTVWTTGGQVLIPTGTVWTSGGQIMIPVGDSWPGTGTYSGDSV